MNFKQLNYIAAVAEHGSITQAAASLAISQPSLSHYISKTEDQLGMKLFDRSTTPISLTYAGERYLQVARQILFASAQLSREMQDLSSSNAGLIRIGIPIERAAYMIPLILPKFSAKYPGVTVEITESGSDNLKEVLLQGKVDFIIAPFHVYGDEFQMETLYEEELLLVTKKGTLNDKHFLRGSAQRVDLTRVQGVPLFLLKTGRGIRTALNLVFNAYGYVPNIAMEVNSNITAYRLASTGAGMAIVPAMTVSLTKAVSPVDVFPFTPHPVTWEVVAIYRRETFISTAERAFLSIARSVF